MSGAPAAAEKKRAECLGIYVHVPFCVKKCLYCDFYSGPAGEAEKTAYIDEVISEIRSCPFGKENEVRSVYFGGGTPSILPAHGIGRVLSELRRNFRFSGTPEITVECNPGTVTAEKLREYRSFGVNRLSFGLQSVQNGILKRIGRIHTFETFLESYALARDAGFTNLGIDLITGLPGDTAEAFENGLKTVLHLSPEHLSVYSLILEENTPFYTLYEAGKLDLPDEEEERRMTHRAAELLCAEGYDHYELSNFAKPGFRSVHNEGYWTGVPYLGFGAAAASFYGGKRFRNAASPDYLNLPYDETEVLTKTDLMNEFLMLGLRRTEGVSDAEFRRRFGLSFSDFKGEAVRKLREEGLLSVKKSPDGEVIALTRRGLDLANFVFREFV